MVLAGKALKKAIGDKNLTYEDGKAVKFLPIKYLHKLIRHRTDKMSVLQANLYVNIFAYLLKNKGALATNREKLVLGHLMPSLRFNGGIWRSIKRKLCRGLRARYLNLDVGRWAAILKRTKQLSLFANC